MDKYNTYKSVELNYKGCSVEEIDKVMTALHNSKAAKDSRAHILKKLALATSNKVMDTIYGIAVTLMTSGYIGVLTTTHYEISVSLFVAGFIVMIITGSISILAEVFFKDSG